MTSSYRHRAARESHQRADGNNKEIHRKENGMKSRYRHLEPLERERESEPLDRKRDTAAVLRAVTYRESSIRGRPWRVSEPLEREDCLTKSRYRQREPLDGVQCACLCV